MSSKSLFFVLVFSIIVVSTTMGIEAETTRETPLLRDGFVINGVDGNLVGPDVNDIWFFELSSDVNDFKTVIKAGIKLQLLPSSTLEQMITNRKTRKSAAYRLWNSRVTKYKGKNFIFPNFFLPVSKEKPTDPNDTATKTEPGEDIELDDPNDILSMPQEVLEKLKAARSAPNIAPSVKKTENSTQKAKRNTNSVFVDRTALLEKGDKGLLKFVPDALGRNVQNLSFRLLPCAMLERTEQIQAAEPETLRFKIAGIVTKYKGQDYMLLEKATRIYSHGNFGR